MDVDAITADAIEIITVDAIEIITVDAMMTIEEMMIMTVIEREEKLIGKDFGMDAEKHRAADEMTMMIGGGIEANGRSVYRR